MLRSPTGAASSSGGAPMNSAYQIPSSAGGLVLPAAGPPNQGNELLKCIEALRDKRDAISRQIADEESEKARLQSDAAALQRRLAAIADSLAKKREARDEYDRVVEQTEAAYAKIVESSHTLLHVLKREATAIAKRRGGNGSSNGGGGGAMSGNGGIGASGGGGGGGLMMSGNGAAPMSGGGGY